MPIIHTSSPARSLEFKSARSNRSFAIVSGMTDVEPHGAMLPCSPLHDVLVYVAQTPLFCFGRLTRAHLVATARLHRNSELFVHAARCATQLLTHTAAA